ncbi:MAG: hypothetical protein ACI9XO_004416 [Paraglaciecola sp.]|jgi:hypothetical protein
MLQKIVNYIIKNPKQLFLIDGFGAILSAFLLGIVLVHFENCFGMPVKALYFLAILPCFFAIYDFICFFKAGENWQPYLRIIAFANLIYCVISIGFVVNFYELLTDLGKLYFLLELIIVLLLVLVELKTATNADN